MANTLVGNIRKIVLPVLGALMLLTGCVSNKNIQATQQEEKKEKDNGIAVIAGLPAITPDVSRMHYLSSNIKLTLIVNGDKVSLKGKLRIKKDGGIQISITPLGLVEVACIEFLPDKVRLINKLFKSYTEVPYSEAAAIGLSGINYGVLESIFLDRVFQPNGQPAYLGLKEFIMTGDTGNSYTIATVKSNAMQYAFTIDKASGHMTQCGGNSSTGESIKCDYSNFKDLSGILYPNRMCISFKGDIALSLDFEHSKLSEKEFQFSSRSISSSYSKQSVGDFINSIK